MTFATVPHQPATRTPVSSRARLWSGGRSAPGAEETGTERERPATDERNHTGVSELPAPAEPGNPHQRRPVSGWDHGQSPSSPHRLATLAWRNGKQPPATRTRRDKRECRKGSWKDREDFSPDVDFSAKCAEKST